MTEQNIPQSATKTFPMTRRKAISRSQDELVTMTPLLSKSSLPLVIQPAMHEVDLISWAKNSQQKIQEELRQSGGILFRNFNISSVAAFEQFCLTFCTELLQYTYRSTPRTQISGKVYSSTEYPADQSILLHNENAYSSTWPLKIWFYAVKPAQKGGETPITDSRTIFRHIPQKIKEHFINKGVMYVRNYNEALDLPWQVVFQTSSRLKVENFCHQAGITFEWKGKNQLMTRQRCSAIAKHPKTDELVWFNQAHLFHISSLPIEVRESLLRTYREEDLPRNAYYGDGSQIEPSVLDEIRAIYEQEAISFPWQEGDILMLDNMLIAHGRRPYVGERKIVTAMAEPLNDDGL
ncbi:MAG: TauD/TfdA family dioxygenase [Ktedonobacteraceae bacterium]